MWHLFPPWRKSPCPCLSFSFSSLPCAKTEIRRPATGQIKYVDWSGVCHLPTPTFPRLPSGVRKAGSWKRGRRRTSYILPPSPHSRVKLTYAYPKLSLLFEAKYGLGYCLYRGSSEMWPCSFPLVFNLIHPADRISGLVDCQYVDKNFTVETRTCSDANDFHHDAYSPDVVARSSA